MNYTYNPATSPEWIADGRRLDTMEDVCTFFSALHNEGTMFHPDDDFMEYVTLDGEPAYTADQAFVRSDLMWQAFEVCKAHGADIYAVCIDILNQFTTNNA